MDDGAASFETSRKRLSAIVYRMLGSVSEAEDVVRGTQGNAGGRRPLLGELPGRPTAVPHPTVAERGPRREAERYLVGLGAVWSEVQREEPDLDVVAGVKGVGHVDEIARCAVR